MTGFARIKILANNLNCIQYVEKPIPSDRNLEKIISAGFAFEPSGLVIGLRGLTAVESEE